MSAIADLNAAPTIATDDAGVREPTLLFIPGWCGDRSYLAPLVSGAAPRRALAMDLRDHGSSMRTEADFGTTEVVDDAIRVLHAAGVDRVVPVGSSHAGWVAIELRRRLGAERVPGVAFVDWMVLGTPPGFTDALAGLQDPDTWEQVRAGLFAMWTTGVDVPALHAYVASMGEYGFRHWSRAGREIAAAFAAEGSPLAALERLPEPCPTLHLYAQPADDAVLAAQQAYAQAHPWFQVQRLDARSHFPMLEVPEALSAALESFVAGLPRH